VTTQKLRQLISNNLGAMLGLALGLCALSVSHSFSSAFTTVKFLVVASVMLLCSLGVFLGEYPLSFPKQKNIRLAFGALGFFLILSIVNTRWGEPITGINLIIVWSLLSFSIFTLFAQQDFKTFFKQLVLFFLPFVVFSFLIFFYKNFLPDALAILQGTETRSSGPRPFFMNPNIVGNFLALCCFQLLFFSQLTNKKKLQYAAKTLFVLGFILLLYYKARGALLGLSLGLLCYWILSVPKKLNFNFFKKPAFLFILAAGTALAFYTAKVKGLNTLEIRLSYWQNTLCLIKNHPTGVGPGAFEYIYRLYDGRCHPKLQSIEGQLIRNPHNIFLEFFAEIGWFGGLVLFFLLFLVLREVWQIKNPAKEKQRQWILSLWALFFGIGFFEFPQDTPFTYFFLAILTGITLATLEQKSIKQSSFFRISLLALSILSMIIFSLKAYSDHLTEHPGPNKHQNYEAAAALDKENWKAHTWLGLSHIEKGDKEKAQASLEFMQKNFPQHHSTYHLEGTFYQKMRDLNKTCEAFLKYHQLHANKSSKEDFINKYCLPKN
jgi:O-antigen ligase